MAKSWGELSDESKLKVVGEGVSALGTLQSGFFEQALQKRNASLSERFGRETFSEKMADVRQAVGSYATQVAASGVSGQSQDAVSRGASIKGSRDAARAAYNFDMEAVNQRFAGRMAAAKSVSDASKSFGSMAMEFIG